MYHNEKTIKIKNLSKEELQTLLDGCKSLADLLRNIGVGARSHYYSVLRKKLAEYNLDAPSRKFGLQTKQKLCDILCKDSSYTRSHLKKRLLASGLLKNECSKCGMGPEWQGEPLSLQVDHINGINNDHRIENLRILCPNCHSQTGTYAGKSLKKDKPTPTNVTCKCGKITNRQTCRSCAAKKGATRKFKITKEELTKLIYEDKMSYRAVGIKFGVTDNTIRKRSKVLGVPIKHRKKTS